jgi:hypothetical protein
MIISRESLIVLTAVCLSFNKTSKVFAFAWIGVSWMADGGGLKWKCTMHAKGDGSAHISNTNNNEHF